uniref:Uncharacterized protein n=1 Tax=Cebus imitator TaxID=2715852 RepID=A0A2K5R4T2_CEBIM
MLSAHRTLHCCFFVRRDIMSPIQCLRSWTDRLPLGSQEEGFPDFDTHGRLGTKALWYGKTNLFLCPLLLFHLSGRLVNSC